MTDSSIATEADDIIDRAVGLAPGMPTHALRHQRDKVVATAQHSHDTLLDPSLADIPLSHRLLVALYASRLTPAPALATHYRERLAQANVDAALVAAAETGSPADFADPALRAIMEFTRILTERPTEGDRAALQKLPAAGLDTPAIVTLAQLIAFISYQTRVVAGLDALKTMQEADEPATTPPAATAEPVADKVGMLANERLSVGAAIEANGFTNAMLKWRAWLDVVCLENATPEQIAAMDAAHQTAKTSDYYLLLAHQPEILRTRSTAFNAVMYAPRGLPRAERELAAMAASRVNGCVYCCSVHARFFEQLAKRNDVVAQLFDAPETAGASPRDRAIIGFSIALTLHPGNVSAQSLRPLQAAGLGELEMLDLIHSVAMFGWANRLMANLGEPYRPTEEN